jgi:hypothetical protein
MSLFMLLLSGWLCHSSKLTLGFLSFAALWWYINNVPFFFTDQVVLCILVRDCITSPVGSTLPNLRSTYVRCIFAERYGVKRECSKLCVGSTFHYHGDLRAEADHLRKCTIAGHTVKDWHDLAHALGWHLVSLKVKSCVIIVKTVHTNSRESNMTKSKINIKILTQYKTSQEGELRVNREHRKKNQCVCLTECQWWKRESIAWRIAS